MNVRGIRIHKQYDRPLSACKLVKLGDPRCQSSLSLVHDIVSAIFRWMSID